MVAAGGYKKDSAAENTAQEVSIADDERRLEEILSQIEGAGEVKVMITYYSSSEKDIAYETKTSLVEDKSESEDKKAVMTGDEPMVVKEVYPRVKGVIVTAQGAGNAAVKAAISDAVGAALDVPAHKICIFKKEE
ncbi:MAG: hypothetical protein LIO53_05630 [Oscillospiraceae bacterium]|nr:hypothetical protein [Oscillospiraceae bacterium]